MVRASAPVLGTQSQGLRASATHVSIAELLRLNQAALPGMLDSRAARDGAAEGEQEQQDVGQASALAGAKQTRTSLAKLEAIRRAAIEGDDERDLEAAAPGAGLRIDTASCSRPGSIAGDHSNFASPTGRCIVTV